MKVDSRAEPPSAVGWLGCDSRAEEHNANSVPSKHVRPLSDPALESRIADACDQIA